MPKKKPSKPSVPDQPYGTIDDVIAEIAGMSIEEIVAAESLVPGPWLITVDELRAAGALDVPPSWRKSLRDDPNPGLFSELPDDDETPNKKHQTKADDSTEDAKG